MATKKQKRTMMTEKRQKFEEEMRRSGLAAQAKDREHRASQMGRAVQDAERRKVKS